MRAYDIIWKKREGAELSPQEIEFLINGYVRGEIPDYQMSAFCMAVFFRGMTPAECTALTLTMAHSGETLDLSGIPGPTADKHSTGGVGDKTSLVVLPLVAASGVTVAKMSGRGLGHTGGTIDKLESIPGFRTDLTREELIGQAEKIGIALTGQTADLVPADKKIYALRDLTATVESIPLIAASIVSKKLAAGAQAIVLDVKYGDGALMRDYARASELAELMTAIGNLSGRKFKAVLSTMDQPLGLAIGNSLEVLEAIQTLRGEGPSDLTELALELTGEMLLLAGRAETSTTARNLAEKALRSGNGLEKFREWITAQGGDPAILDRPGLMPQAPVVHPVRALATGYVAEIRCRELGVIAMNLGAGRSKPKDKINPEVGLIIKAKTGDYLKKGDLLAEVHALSEKAAQEAANAIQMCFTIGEQSVPPVSLFPVEIE